MAKLSLWVWLLAVVCPLGASAQSTQALLDQARERHFTGRWREAIPYYLEVAVLARESDPAAVGVALNNACDAYNNLGDFRAALELCGKAIDVRRQLDDELRLARTLNNLGISQQYLGMLAEARESFSEALEINRRLDDARGEGINLSNLGLVAMAGEHYTDAMAFFESAARLARRGMGEPWARAQEALALMNQGVVLERVGAFREALDRYRWAAERLDDGDPWRRAALEVNIGVVYRNLGDPVRAAESFQTAADTYLRLGDQASRANALVNLALALHLNLEQPRRAEEAFGEALAAAQSAGDRNVQTGVLLGLGGLLLATGRVDEAATSFRQAETLAEEESANTRLAWALHGLARVAEARGELLLARERLVAAMAAIDRARSGFDSDHWRAGFSAGYRGVYATAVRVLIALNRGESTGAFAVEALEVVQRAKARELIEVLVRSSDGSDSEPDSEPGRGPTAVPLAASAPISLPTLPLRQGTTVIEYYLGDGELFAWRTDSRVEFKALGPAAPALEAAGRVHAALTAGRDLPQEDVRTLSAILIAPLVTAGDQSREIFIAADGSLRNLPFEILRDPANSDQPLIDRVAVAYLPSTVTLARLRQNRRRPAAGLLAMGDPTLPEGGLRFGLASVLVDRFALEQLPAARREVVAIAEQLPGAATLLVGEQATEAALRRQLARGARIVHLATHTVVDDRPGRGAAIVLAPGDGEDGVVSPEEIAALSWPAELTVLAACRSAVVQGEDASALGSLTGALLAAGSSSVIASLWDVDDAATAVVMEQLYHRLARGDTPSEALRAVKLKLRSDPGWNRPEVWAAFVLVGDATAVVSPSRIRPWSILAVGAGIFALVVLAWRLTPRPESSQRKFQTQSRH